MFLYGILLCIFSWLLLRLSESSQIHLIHPLTHSHTLTSHTQTKPSVYFPPSSCCHFDHLQELEFLFLSTLQHPCSSSPLHHFSNPLLFYPPVFTLSLPFSNFFLSLFLSTTCLLFSYFCFLRHSSFSHSIKSILITSVNHIYICKLILYCSFYTTFWFKHFRALAVLGFRLETLITFNCECVKERRVPWAGIPACLLMTTGIGFSTPFDLN